jgi:hypothetical protein
VTARSCGFDPHRWYQLLSLIAIRVRSCPVDLKFGPIRCVHGILGLGIPALVAPLELLNESTNDGSLKRSSTCALAMSEAAGQDVRKLAAMLNSHKAEVADPICGGFQQSSVPQFIKSCTGQEYIRHRFNFFSDRKSLYGCVYIHISFRRNAADGDSPGWSEERAEPWEPNPHSHRPNRADGVLARSSGCHHAWAPCAPLGRRVYGHIFPRVCTLGFHRRPLWGRTIPSG